MNLIDFWRTEGQPASRSQDVPAHVRAIEELLPIIEHVEAKTVIELGSGERPTTLETLLAKQGIKVVTLDVQPGSEIQGDMHYMPNIASQSFDLAVARHSLEHCIAPYYALKEMTRIAKQALVILPEYNKRFAFWQGHMSVFPRSVWERMFHLMSLKVEYFSIGDFSNEEKIKNLEWRYLLTMAPMTMGPYERDGHYIGKYPKLAREGWQ